MLGPWLALRERLRRRRRNEEAELTVETSNLTPEQIATAVKALRILGLEERQAQLSKHDLIIFLYAMGLNPTDDIIDSKIRAYNLHYKKSYTFGQLAHVWHSMLQDLTDEDELLKRAFQFFDKDGNGEISVQELKTTMRELGDLLTEKEITEFMSIMDVNNDGVIGYNEFLATLKTQVAETSLDAGDRLDSVSVGELSRPTQHVANPPQYYPDPLNVPAGAITPGAPPSPFAQHHFFAAAAAANGGAGPTEGPRGPGETVGSGGLASGGLAPQTTASMRRTTSLKPSLTPPPPAAAEPLLNGDNTSGAPQRLPSRRAGLPPMEQRSGEAAAAAAANGLRAPSALDQSPGSDRGDGAREGNQP